jgi:protein-disulfide isomerase
VSRGASAGGRQQDERRRKLLQLASGAAFLAVLGVAVLVVINTSGTSGGDTRLEGVGRVDRLLGGIPQHGMLLGEPGAPATLVEFGDLKCPHCADYSSGIVADVIRSQVRSGRAALEFRNFTVIDAQSAPAGAAALAAGEQGRGWSFVEIFYGNQGDESEPYADDAFLSAVAQAAGVRDMARWNRERESPRLMRAVERSSAEAEGLGFTGTPSFALSRPGGALEPLGTPGSAEELESAISSASG